MKKKYDLIISNPPFFRNDYKVSKNSKSIARHTLSLDYKDLLRKIQSLSHDKTMFAIMMPPESFQYFESILDKNIWNKNIEILCAYTNQKKVHLHLALFSKSKTELKIETLFYKNEDLSETIGFKKLLENYYLYLKKNES